MIRRIATFVILASYGAVALLGPELHELLGCHHHEHAIEYTWQGANQPDQQSPAFAATESRAEFSRDDADDESSHDHDGCAICKLSSMAQNAAIVELLNWVLASAPVQASFSSGHIPAAPLSSCRIRAPPFLAG